jgi:FkbM family methyltransferase
MDRADRKVAFVLASTKHGTMIVSRLDYRMLDGGRGYGVGFDILETGSFAAGEIKTGNALLGLRRKHHGDGVVAIDCGANIGVHTIEWASSMTGWGSVIAIEAQERIYYALAGNIAISNCLNATVIHGAVASEPGTMRIPSPNYLLPASFGSLELRKRNNNEFIGQAIDYDYNTVCVRKLTIDQLELPRVDLIKLDIEGMELEALAGGVNTIKKSRPILLIEKIKTDSEQLKALLARHGYVYIEAGINCVAIHQSDNVRSDIKLETQAGLPTI